MATNAASKARQAGKSARGSSGSDHLLGETGSTIEMWCLKKTNSKSVHPPASLLSSQIQVGGRPVKWTSDDPFPGWPAAISAFFGPDGERFFDRVRRLTPSNQQDRVLAFAIALHGFPGRTKVLRELHACCDRAIDGNKLKSFLLRRFVYTIYDGAAMRELKDTIRESKNRAFRGISLDVERDLLAIVHAATMEHPLRLRVGHKRLPPWLAATPPSLADDDDDDDDQEE